MYIFNVDDVNYNIGISNEGGFNMTAPDNERPLLKCKRCSWEWFQTTYVLPTVCPRCRSPYWNKVPTLHPVLESKAA